jgi:hypothetical protein
MPLILLINIEDDAAIDLESAKEIICLPIDQLLKQNIIFFGCEFIMSW